MTTDIKALALRLAQDAAMKTGTPYIHAGPWLHEIVRAALAAGLRMGAQGVADNAWACHIESIMHKVLMSNAAALRAKADELERQTSTNLPTD